MKTKKNELDVDFIGGQNLTKEEEQKFQPFCKIKIKNKEHSD